MLKGLFQKYERYIELPVGEDQRPMIDLGNGKKSAQCQKCDKPYPYHNEYTPLVCIPCDPLAYKHPPAK